MYKIYRFATWINEQINRLFNRNCRIYWRSFYPLFLLTSLRKIAGGSLLEKLPLNVHKNISAYLFNLNLGNGAIDYVDATEEKSQGDDMAIIGDGMDNVNAFEFSF